MLTFDVQGRAHTRGGFAAATQAAAAQRQRKLTMRLTKGEKRHVKRIAQVAAVYTITQFVWTPEDLVRDLRPDKARPGKRPRPEGKRAWADLAKEQEEVIDEAFRGCRVARSQTAETLGCPPRWNADQLARVREAAKRHRVNVTIVLDLIHVLEYLWMAAYVFTRGLARGRGPADRTLAGAAVRRGHAGHRLDLWQRHLPGLDRRRAETGGYRCRLHRTTNVRSVQRVLGCGAADRDGRHRKRPDGNHRGAVEP